MTIEVFWGSRSPYSWRVLLALEMKQIAYESKHLSFSAADLTSDEFLAVNPRAQLPAIRDGGFTLYESIAILVYLDGKYPMPPLFGRNLDERSLIWRTIMECTYYLEPHLIPFAGRIFSGELDLNRREIVHARIAVEQELIRIDKLVRLQDYLAGNQTSAADIAYYPIIQLLIKAALKDPSEAVGGTLTAVAEHYPAVQAWFERIRALPGYRRTLACSN